MFWSLAVWMGAAIATYGLRECDLVDSSLSVEKCFFTGDGW